MEADSDEELCYITSVTSRKEGVEVSAAQTLERTTNLLSHGPGEARSLGTWVFDKKQRQRKYIALTGKVYTGSEAIHMARADKNSDRNPSRMVRSELMHNFNERTLDQFQLLLSDATHPLNQLTSWGFPEVVVSRYHRNRVTTLFAWQVACLTVDNFRVLTSIAHLIYSAPTSGGKTLVSEILMLRCLARHMSSQSSMLANSSDPALAGPPTVQQKNRHTIFFVVPFVALAEEKAAYFQDIWQDMNVGVKAFHGDGGDVGGNTLSEDVEVAVCTIERANILLTQLLDEGREDQLKMVVIDEIHMLADAQRGFLLEVMLSKIKYLLNDHVQVVGMSATLPNIADLAGWLGASLYTTEYRPVDLSVRVCVNKTLYVVNKVASAAAPECVRAAQSRASVPEMHEGSGSAAATLPPASALNPLGDSGAVGTAPAKAPAVVEYVQSASVGLLPEDPDGMKRLCLDTVASGKSAMLFCNSKRRCEVCAAAVADAIVKHMATVFAGYVAHPAARAARLAVVDSLAQTQVGLCPILRQTVPHGVAYHHAGLTLDERKVIEDAFRQGYIQVLCTTSTLSAGVNMPAHRVIIRSPRMGDKFLNVSAFRQMCGRAGRMGLDAQGEAILMIMNGNKTERAVADHLLTADLDPLLSSLHIGAGGGLEKLLLEMVSCGRLQNESQVMRFIDCTLMRVQHPVAEVSMHTRDALVFLRKEQFVQALSDGKLAPTPLGIATTVSGIAPKDAVQILKPLMDARSKLILKGGLHPVFLVTPPSTPIEPDWKNYEKILHVLYQEHPDAEAVATYLGIEPGQLCTYAFNPPTRSASNTKALLYRRFFSAILLFSLIQEWPITRVARLITTATRGQLQQLQKDAAVFCGMTVVFCKKLNWPMLASCLEDFSSRLNYGAHKDILPLVRIGQEVTAGRARVFLKNGIESALDIAQAGVRTLTELLVDSLPYDGKDPLLAGQDTAGASLSVAAGTGSNNGSGSGSGPTGTLTNPRSKEIARSMCERLAKKIIARAKEALREEAARIYQQMEEDIL